MQHDLPYVPRQTIWLFIWAEVYNSTVNSVWMLLWELMMLYSTTQVAHVLLYDLIAV